MIKNNKIITKQAELIPFIGEYEKPNNHKDNILNQIEKMDIEQLFFKKHKRHLDTVSNFKPLYDNAKEYLKNILANKHYPKLLSATIDTAKVDLQMEIVKNNSTLEQRIKNNLSKPSPK